MAYKHQGFVNHDKEKPLTAEQLIAMEDAIIDLMPTSYKYTATECYEAFIAEMNKKAKELGATNTTFIDSSGRFNKSTARDIAKIVLNASSYEKLYDIWNSPTYTANIVQADGTIRNFDMISSYTNRGYHSAVSILIDNYNIMGGKTGTFANQQVYNLASVIQSNKNPDDWYIVTAMNANETNSGTGNRFQATKDIMDIVEGIVEQIPEKDVTALDDIAYGGLTYRDIFITNNLAPRINNNSMGGYAVATGTVTLESNTTSANNYVPPYSLKCFGSSTCQIKSNKEYAYNANTKYYMASNIKVNRYTSGYVGVFPSGAVYDATISEVTDGWVTKSAIITLNSTKDPYDLRIGTAQANMDAYINNPVIIDMSIFETPPDEDTLNTLYSQYNSILIDNGGTTASADVCCKNACVYKKPNHSARAFRYLNLETAYEKNADEILSPASNSKIMTSLLCLDYIPDLKSTVTVTQDDITLAETYTYYKDDLFVGEKLSYEDLLYAMYLTSSNVSSCIIARNVGERILRSKNL